MGGNSHKQGDLLGATAVRREVMMAWPSVMALETPFGQGHSLLCSLRASHTANVFRCLSNRLEEKAQGGIPGYPSNMRAPGSLQGQDGVQVVTQRGQGIFSSPLAFPRIVLNSIDYSLLCPGNSYFLCKLSQKVTNHGKILLVLDAAKAERACLALWCGGRTGGCATGKRAGKWTQVARLSHRVLLHY